MPKKRDELLSALKGKAPTTTVRAGTEAVAMAMAQEEQRLAAPAPSPKRARKKAAAKKKLKKRSLSVALGEEDLRILRPIQQCFEQTYSRSCGLATAVRIAVRSMNPNTDTSAIAMALIDEDQRGKRE